MDEPTVNQANLAMPQQIGLHVPRMYRVAFRMLADADKMRPIEFDPEVNPKESVRLLKELVMDVLRL